MAPCTAVSKHVARKSPARLRRRARRWLWGLGVALAVSAGVGYLAWNYGWEGIAGVGVRAPAFVLEDGEGRPVDLSDYIGRKPVLLAFYMTYG